MNSQGVESIAIGKLAGLSNQDTRSIAIGSSAGKTSQNTNCIAIGYRAGETSQNANSIAIGTMAGNSNQGSYGIAIGYGANTQDNSIVLNATNTPLYGSQVNATYIKPIRSSALTSGNLLCHTTSSEVLDTTINVTGTEIRIRDSSNSSSFRTQWTNDTATITAAKDGSDATRMNFFTQAVGGNTSNTLHLYNSNVGVGTTNPLFRLDTRLTVQSGTAGPTANSYPIASFIGSEIGGGSRGLEIGVPTGSVIDSPVYLKISGTAASFAILNQSDVQNFTFTSDGKVGIGATIPDNYQLHIVRKGGTSGNILLDGDTSVGGNPKIIFRTTNTSNVGILDFNDTANSFTFSRNLLITGSNVAATYPLTAYNSSNGTSAAFGGTARGIRIDNDGPFSVGRNTIYGVDNTFYASYQPLAIGGSVLYFSIAGSDKLTITSSGYVHIGTGFSATNHRINLAVNEGTRILVVSAFDTSAPGSTNDTAIFYGCNGANPSAVATGLGVTTNSISGRSISTGGSVNTAGNDYAEYMTKAVEDDIAKGDIVGINSEGELTNIFDDSISFVVKSTNPSYVGGDVWGNTVGQRPSRTTDQTDEEFLPILAEFEARLELARAKVDRIAFSGQVPCNVIGANIGDYIIPIETDDGKISGQPISKPTFEQYQIAVGKVWKIMEDGRAWIAVKIG